MLLQSANLTGHSQAQVLCSSPNITTERRFVVLSDSNGSSTMPVIHTNLICANAQKIFLRKLPSTT